MTGRELIIFILSNNLENEEVIDENGKPLGFMTVEEAAVKFNVGTAIMQAWVDTGIIPSIKLGDVHYIPQQTK